MRKTKTSQTVKISGDVVFRQLAKDDGILIDLKSKNYFSLNETACLIVSSLMKGQSKQKIIEKLSAKYGEPSQTIRHDVEKTIKELFKENILS